MTLPQIKKKFEHKIAVTKKGCWIWTGWRHRQGYARIQIGRKRWLGHRFGRKRWLGHRLTYFLFHGSVPPVLDHEVCNTPCCVNPTHVVPATQKHNSQRSTKAKIDAAIAFMLRLDHGPPRGRGVRRYPTVSELKKRYGVSSSIIFHVINNHCWKTD